MLQVLFSSLLSLHRFFITYHCLSLSLRRPIQLPPRSTHSTDMSLSIVRGNIAAWFSLFFFLRHVAVSQQILIVFGLGYFSQCLVRVYDIMS